MDEEIVREFEKDMYAVYGECKNLGYNAHYFYDLLEKRDGLRTAQFLLGSAQPAEGFYILYTLKPKPRLDLSVETLVLIPRYSVLFNEQERKIARDRLADGGYTHDARWDASN